MPYTAVFVLLFEAFPKIQTDELYKRKGAKLRVNHRKRDFDKESD
jgi:hypothetical protein